jgi:hypothetical protein
MGFPETTKQRSLKEKTAKHSRGSAVFTINTCATSPHDLTRTNLGEKNGAGLSDQQWEQPKGYGSIPIITIFSGMNMHLPAILM